MRFIDLISYQNDRNIPRRSPTKSRGRTGTDIGASSNNTARAPDSRLGASAETAVSGSVPAGITWRSAASNAMSAALGKPMKVAQAG